MTETTIYVWATRDAIMRALATLPQRARAGGVVQDAMLTDAGEALLDRIQEAFAKKSQGGIDDANESWKPLAPRTIARRLAKRSQATVTERAAHPSQALTEKQRERWWSIYRQQLARFRGNKSSAAKVAWTILKGEGAHTLLDKYGMQKVDILRDTGELLESLTPHSGSSRSVFRILPGEVELGTKRPHALSHHLGDPSRNLPQRRLWTDPEKWPDSWWYDILLELQSGVVELAIQTARDVEGGQ